MSRLIRNSLALATAALLACGPSGSKETIPRLPGDGSANTAKVTDPPPPKKVEEKPDANPWKGRTDLIATPEAKPPGAVKLPPIKRFRLPNGLSVIIVENRDLPVVSMQLAVKVGRADETRGKTGLSEMVASMLTKGTRKRSALKIAKAIDFVGGSLGGRSSFEASLVSCSVMSKNLKTCLALLPDVISSPTFPKALIGEVRSQMHASVRQRRDDAGRTAAAHFQNLLWGEKHVRGWPMSSASIESIKRKHLVAFHRKWYRPNNAVLAIAGDVDAKKLRWQLQNAFKFWYRAPVPKRKAYKDPEMSGVKVRLVDKPGQTQSHIRIGHLGLSHKDKDFYDTMVFNYVLGGGGFSSRLMKVVRSEGGKTYGVRSGFDRNLDRGAFVVSTFTRSKETVSTIKLILTEVAKMAKAGPSAAEVSDAITNITGRYSTRFESAAAVASALLGAHLHGFKASYVRDYALEVGKVTPASAKAAAAARLDVRKFALVIVGDAKKIEPMLRRTGLPFEKVGHLEAVAGYERNAVNLKADPKAAKAGRALLNKALAAKGGKAKLMGIKTMALQGDAKLTLQGRRVPATVQRVYEAPNRMRLDMSIAGGMFQITTVLNKTTGWVRQARGKQSQVQDLPASEIVLVAAQLWRDQELVLLRHLEKGTVAQALKKEKIDGVLHHVVRVTRGDGKLTVKLYLDPKTFLLRRMSYKDQGAATVESYTDYKKVDGMQIAHTRKTKSPRGAFDATLKSIVFNKTVPTKLWDKPPAKK